MRPLAKAAANGQRYAEFNTTRICTTWEKFADCVSGREPACGLGRAGQSPQAEVARRGAVRWRPSHARVEDGGPAAAALEGAGDRDARGLDLARIGVAALNMQGMHAPDKE